MLSAPNPMTVPAIAAVASLLVMSDEASRSYRLGLRLAAEPGVIATRFSIGRALSGVAGAADDENGVVGHGSTQQPKYRDDPRSKVSEACPIV
jgi:hypothetical protein